MRKIELVTHCFRYSRVLNYQLASIKANPPESAQVTVTIFGAEDDKPTRDVIRYWWEQCKSLWPDVMIRPIQILPLPLLLRRAIGRNYAALNTKADLVWFLDCDLVFGPGCLETLATIDLPDDKLFYPRTTLIQNTHALGDEYALRAAAGPGIYPFNPADFHPEQHRGIGGAQIVPGDVAREYGYCRDDPKRLAPVTDGQWKVTRGDVTFRKILGTKGSPIDLPNLYRIRQTREGVVDTL